MNTQNAVKLFLESRRSKRLSKVTIDTYAWVLGKLAEMFPGELPENTSDIQRLFIAELRTIGFLPSDYLEQAAHILVVGGARRHLLQCHGWRSRPGNEAQAAPHTPP